MEARVMGGTSVGADSILLEHTLAMVGDDVEGGGIWQGWPVQMVLAGPKKDNKDKDSASSSKSTGHSAPGYGAL